MEQNFKQQLIVSQEGQSSDSYIDTANGLLCKQGYKVRGSFNVFSWLISSFLQAQFGNCWS